jgi:hypothetical protein
MEVLSICVILAIVVSTHLCRVVLGAGAWIRVEHLLFWTGFCNFSWNRRHSGDLRGRHSQVEQEAGGTNINLVKSLYRSRP